MSDSARIQPTFDAPLMVRPPVAPTPAPPAPAPTQAPASSPSARIFVTDRPQPGDGPLDPAVLRVAQLLAHRGAEGPLTVGLLGGAGTGKSRALAVLAGAVDDLSRGGADNAESPFLPRIAIVALDAADIAGDPRAALAERLHVALARRAPDVAAAAAEEASHASSDPHAMARSLSETLDNARRRLDAERQARDEAETRRARLVESILYDSGGSRVDAYARAHRASIESALAAFGFVKDDPLAAYKGLVHTLAEAGGTGARWLASLRALWGYTGQGKRIAWTIVFLLLAWGVGALRDSTGWLDPLNNGGDTLQNAANGIRAHLGWFDLVRKGFLLAAALCVLSLAWRAIRFQAPLLRGAALLDSDVEARRSEIDNLVAHHAQRVEALAAESDAIARRAAEAERRAGAAAPVKAPPTFLASASAPDQSRRAFIAAVAAQAGQNARAPGRILVTLDDLDQLAPAAALDLLERMRAMLDGRAFAMVAAFDPARIVNDVPDARDRLLRVVQVPLHVEPRKSVWRDVIGALAAPRAAAKPPALNPAQSPLDMPIDETEQKLLAGLALLAGPSPRGVKRFVNLYRLGRHDAAEDLAAFALMLALSIGGTPDEAAAVDAAIAAGEGNTPLRREGLPPRLLSALDTILALQGHSMSTGEAIRAKALAARWAL
jgi:hypothetical protein